jgi:hypothetical protein
MGRACSTNGEKRNAYGILMAKPERKRQLASHRCRWENNIKNNNIKMDLEEIGWEYLDCISLTKYRGQQLAFVSTVMNFLLS